ncbi:DUF6138 family protein [Paenibacillus tianmuensis]|uniref:DUF6138 family protein n=1 Tax=Paenibacillus tianmuensis TaxID=624147 RepID=UPI003CCBE8E2
MLDFTGICMPRIFVGRGQALISVLSQFFFAHHLVNPDLMEQRQEVIVPLIRRA